MPEENKTEGEEVGAKDEMSLAQVTETLNAIMPQIAELNKAMSGLGGGESSTEDVCKDEEDPEAKDEEEKEGEGMDSIVAENAALKKQVESLTGKVDSGAQDGMKTLIGQISKRDALAKSISSHVGTFTHSEMTLDEVAKYGVEKLGIACDSGQEISTLNGFLHQRSTSTQAHSMDSKPAISAIDTYITGGA